MKTKHIVYYLDKKDFSENEMYNETRIILQEIEDESRFDTREEAVEKAMSLVDKHTQTTVLEVYCI